MSKHTKAPWHAGAGNGEGSVFADEGRMRLEEGGTTLYPIAEVICGWNEEEDEANRNLIVASPELLESLEEIVGQIEKTMIAGYLGTERVERAKARIAKARGLAEASGMALMFSVPLGVIVSLASLVVVAFLT